MAFQPTLPFPVAIWDEHPLQATATVPVVPYFWHYDPTLDEWSVVTTAVQASGAPRDTTGSGDFQFTLFPAMPPGSTRLAVAQRGTSTDLIAYTVI